ncbi:MAG: sigma-70 family RNA polymerase sigma factor [Planctomycetes bacterium]|nr:sigma-70 family RNA polymerase sigma factor [Planctomycetota bacterium]
MSQQDPAELAPLACRRGEEWTTAERLWLGAYVLSGPAEIDFRVRALLHLGEDAAPEEAEECRRRLAVERLPVVCGRYVPASWPSLTAFLRFVLKEFVVAPPELLALVDLGTAAWSASDAEATWKWVGGQTKGGDPREFFRTRWGPLVTLFRPLSTRSFLDYLKSAFVEFRKTPANLLRLFDRRGNEWTREEAGEASEWAKSKLVGAAGSAELEGLWQDFQLPLLTQKIPLYDPARGKRFLSFVRLCFRQFCSDRSRSQAMPLDRAVSLDGSRKKDGPPDSMVWDVAGRGPSPDSDPFVSEELPAFNRFRAALEECLGALRREEEDTNGGSLPAPGNRGRARYWTTIHLHYFEGLSLVDIAKLLHAEENTVDTWHHRGKELLRKCLESKGFPAARVAGVLDALDGVGVDVRSAALRFHAQLPREDRRILSLLYPEGCSEDVAGKRMGLAPEEVRKRAADALTWLRARLAEAGYPDNEIAGVLTPDALSAWSPKEDPPPA